MAVSKGNMHYYIRYWKNGIESTGSDKYKSLSEMQGEKATMVKTAGQAGRIMILASTFFLVAVDAAPSPQESGQENSEVTSSIKVHVVDNPFVEKGFIHIMGPSPAILPGQEGTWDDWILESSDIFKDGHTYYWYYHARGAGKNRPRKGYQVGVATAPGPLGPWTRYEGNPILGCGPDGSWDSEWVACGCVMKETVGKRRPAKDTYYLWYSGGGPEGTHIGLATSSSPLGPWRKYERNPVLKTFGYLGSVVKVGGKFFLFSEHPVGSSSPDQGPMSIAIADHPAGPWVKYERNPILTPGDWGAWDDGGYSEASVRYSDGIFHWFYSGTKATKLESIGYAYSLDGFRWTKYPGNPILPLNRVPDASGFAEVKALIEPPFVYLYHTLRYISEFKDEKGQWVTEHLAIQVLSTTPKFRIPFPILQVASLGPRKETTWRDCRPVSLENASSCALTVRYRHGPQVMAGLSLHVRSSSDGISYDTTDLLTFDIEAGPGEIVGKTMNIVSGVRFFKVICQSLEESAEISNLEVTATVGN